MNMKFIDVWKIPTAIFEKMLFSMILYAKN
jgi:hypothetical protein